MHIAALTRGTNAPSTRFRVRQLVPELQKQGITVDEFPARFEATPTGNSRRKAVWAAQALSDVPRRISSVSQSDLVWLQKPILMNMRTFEGLIRPPIIFDVDDAIWLSRFGKSSSHIASHANVTLVGNEFLADFYSRYGPVEILPTAVDTNRWVPQKNRNAKTLVWSGSSSGFRELKTIVSSIQKLLSMDSQIQLRIVSDSYPSWIEDSLTNWEFIKWSPSIEVSAIASGGIGLMPLVDTQHNRGKCSMKMLLYMSCGLPAVVSPVGNNIEVNRLGNGSFLAQNETEWTETLLALIRDDNLREKAGVEARRIVNENFNIRMTASKLKHIFESNT